MKHLALVLLTCAALTSACKKKNADSGGAGTATATGTKTTPPPPFTGKVTIDRLLGARDLVKPFDPWDDGFAKLQALVGAPTKIEGARHTWAVVDGDLCAWFYVTKDNGADYKMEGIIVGTVQTPKQTNKGDADGGHNACLKAAGVDLGPPEDPNAAGPPADGAAVPLADVRKNVIPGRSKWKDQKVSVAATLGGISTTTQSDDKYVTVNLTSGADDKEEPLGCAYEKNAPAPDLKQGTAVIATGTMKIQEWTSMGTGAVTLKPGLVDCTVATGK